MAADRALFGMRYRIVFKHDEVESLRVAHSTTTITVGRLAPCLAGLLTARTLQAVFPEFME
ncbi:hypothetical protein AA957_22805 [Pseudomonas trivialis]|uniref:Uncharacterized protein n=1 Tax=Pseudomonas trivialis TaxID=200450 RepID=A0A0H5ACW9_9PSED|nr:hypothetical protein AA957_22805 [Pseudomonas trivialis]